MVEDEKEEIGYAFRRIIFESEEEDDANSNQSEDS
jgi:hypothetical protein